MVARIGAAQIVKDQQWWDERRVDERWCVLESGGRETVRGSRFRRKARVKRIDCKSKTAETSPGGRERECVSKKAAGCSAVQVLIDVSD